MAEGEAVAAPAPVDQTTGKACAVGADGALPKREERRSKGKGAGNNKKENESPSSQTADGGAKKAAAGADAKQEGTKTLLGVANGGARSAQQPTGKANVSNAKPAAGAGNDQKLTTPVLSTEDAKEGGAAGGKKRSGRRRNGGTKDKEGGGAVASAAQGQPQQQPQQQQQQQPQQPGPAGGDGDEGGWTTVTKEKKGAGTTSNNGNGKFPAAAANKAGNNKLGGPSSSSARPSAAVNARRPQQQQQTSTQAAQQQRAAREQQQRQREAQQRAAAAEAEAKAKALAAAKAAEAERARQQHLASMNLLGTAVAESAVVECLAVPLGLREWMDRHPGEVSSVLMGVKSKSGAMSVVLARGEEGKQHEVVVTAMGAEAARKARALLEVHVKNLETLARTEKRLLQVQEDISAVQGAMAAGLRIEFSVDPDLTGIVIGKKGERIKRVYEATGVTKIDVTDQGVVRVAGPTNGAVLRAREMLELVQEDVPLAPSAAQWLSRPMLADVKDKSEAAVVRALEDSAAPGVRIIGTRQQLESAKLLLETQLEYIQRHQQLRASEDAMRRQLYEMDARAYIPPASASAIAAQRQQRDREFPPLSTPATSSGSKPGVQGQPRGGGGAGKGGGDDSARRARDRNGNGNGNGNAGGTQQQQQQQQQQQSKGVTVGEAAVVRNAGGGSGGKGGGNGKGQGQKGQQRGKA